MRLAILAAAALLVAGCGTPPKERYYTLSPAGAAPASAAGPATGSRIAVGPVTVPEPVDQPQLVLTVAANRLALREYERWASPLKSEIARAIAVHLAQELGTPRVWAFSQAFGAFDYQVLVDVQRFDSTLDDGVAIEALWTIRGEKGTPKTGRSSVREKVSGPGFDALVAAHGRALAAVSREIAAAMRGP